MDVLFAEGQFRYLESLGSDIKKLIPLWERPEVDSITGLPPPIAIAQIVFARNPRSTVATMTDMDDLLKMLFVTMGTIFCPCCGKELKAQSIDEMTEEALSIANGEKFVILAPLNYLLSRLTVKDVISFIKKEGFIRVRLDGEEILLDRPFEPKDTPRSIQVVVDRLIMKDDLRPRITDSLALALRLGDGSAIVETASGTSLDFSETARCRACNLRFPRPSSTLFSRYHPVGMCKSCHGKGCKDCKDTGLDEFPRAIKIMDHSYPELLSLSMGKLSDFLENLSETDHFTSFILQPIMQRLTPILQLNLAYLSLSRPVPTLSGGEFQRLRLATQSGRRLSGILYILDEPTIGLHPKEKEILIRLLKKLREEGNTVLVLEHDLTLIKEADHVLELGPGPGLKGGRLIFEGTPKALEKSKESITGPYLSGKKAFGKKKKIREPKGRLKISNARSNNLKDISVSIPMGCLVTITGVSGSGKSSLLMKEIYPAVKADAVILDQSPIFSTKYSIPATYLGIYSRIRMLFSKTPLAREKGLSQSFFSLTKKGGRCEKCRGQGFILHDLEFLPPVRSSCSLCGGKRFNREALEIKFKGLNMADVLDLDMEAAARLFSHMPSIRKPIEAAERAGLGYIKLGQPVSTLSGGENQRLKLAKELSKIKKGHIFYLFDELSRGLHPSDMEKILKILDELLDEGHSIIAIEHDRQVLSVSDWIIELGPGGGPEGGKVISEGKDKSNTILKY